MKKSSVCSRLVISFTTFIFLIFLGFAQPLYCANQVTWAQLITAINSGNINAVKGIVPRKIKSFEKTFGGKSILEMAIYNEGQAPKNRKHNYHKVVVYLTALQHKGKVAPKKTGKKRVTSVKKVRKPVRKLVPKKLSRKAKKTVKRKPSLKKARVVHPKIKRVAKRKGAGARTWEQLIKAIEQGNLARVKRIVPSIIAPYEKTRGGHSLVEVANYHNALNIANYLEQLLAGRTVRARKKVITFYHAHKPYFEFTNFYRNTPFNLGGEYWPTSEHYFQAHKFEDAHQRDEIRAQLSPRDAFDRARALDVYKRMDWDLVKDGIMLTALWGKFTQNPQLANVLLQTNNATLCEASEGKDIYWGVDQHGYGYNRLGLCLELVRRELRNGRNINNPPSADELPIAQKKKWF